MSARRLKSLASRDAGKVFDRQTETDAVARALVAYLCEVENRLLKLEGATELDAATIRAALKAKATGA